MPLDQVRDALRSALEELDSNVYGDKQEAVKNLILLAHSLEQRSEFKMEMYVVLKERSDLEGSKFDLEEAITVYELIDTLTGKTDNSVAVQSLKHRLEQFREE